MTKDYDVVSQVSSEKILKATHTGKLLLGNVEIPCFVLENGTRVISGRGMQSSLGFSRNSSGLNLINLIDSKLKPFLKDKTIDNLKSPLSFERRGGSGSAPLTHGYDATIFVEICDALLQANENGAILTKSQEKYVPFASLIIRSLAKIGIIGLIDEATNFQTERKENALQELLDKFIRKEFAAWTKRFPNIFYKEIYRLRGWAWGEINKYPSCVGMYTNVLVYERLSAEILEELRKKNPTNDQGYRTTKHHQWLTDIGHSALSEHLHAVIALMRASSGWDQFYEMIERSFPKKNENFLFKPE